MVRLGIGIVISMFVAAKALRAAAVHKAANKALQQDPSMTFAVIEETVLLHLSEAKEFDSLPAAERGKLIATGIIRNKVFTQKAAQ